ncbi:MAG: hypothetical protein B6U87_01565 [Candidatus Aenigmarchaeota archaeon ex4484_52]|nr:MAG: hypothetical protein B6U87_01565 [Candidatus Aenigmarchaeota archaeon ex4484_52]
MKEKIALISIFVNLLLAVGKILIGILSNSASILAEGIHSGIDVLSSLISLIGIKIAKKPVDKKHPYGYYKFEVLAGLIITIMLFTTGAGIIYNAYNGFLSHPESKLSYFAFGIMIFSAIINEFMARLKIRYGKKENSISLVSDGIHSRIDVYMSVAVLFGLYLSKYWIYVDSLIALLIGIYIIKESISLGKQATDSLLDVSAGEEIESKIKNIAKEQNIKISELKTQKKAFAITADIEIVISNKLNVEEAIKISNKLREILIDKIKNLEYVAIQINSHNITNNFFKPMNIFSKTFEKGFGWQRKGKGPEGYCVCPKCKHRQKHKKGIPCSTIKCPICGKNLKRE